MERPPDRGAVDPVAQSIDGATGDTTVSGDAMRWSPDLVEEHRAGAVAVPWALPGGGEAGLGALLGLDAPTVRRALTGAATSLATVAGDVVAELRQRARGTDGDREGGPAGGAAPPPAG
ncbi:hypothetical protein [Geodermatophilus sp. DSM 44513]|uniref:hypothetical protein n=1 Tax=Geodermatophilus sp. DSM 44513 TaxID=1528104 RepID=UPI001272B7CE|nr:hypothetical protein [Geodermatophilus sp. DSM 44513]WNV74230.1 hypothetical protein RTG05_14660 [Geodermatophilus sp. DSM 44513]